VATTEGDFGADALLVAIGDVPSPAHRSMLRGAAAHDLYDAAELPAMRDGLEELTSGRVVLSILGAPYKCSPAPYEAALIVDAKLRDRGVRDHVEIVMTTPQPMTLPIVGPDASRYVADRLGDHGIELREKTAVDQIDGDAGLVTFADGSTLDFSILLGVPASTPPPIVAASGLAGPSGWIEPDRLTLQTGFDRVYAVGDCTMIPTATAQLPKAGVFAAGEGRVAAVNILADLYGDAGESFDGHGFCFLELPGNNVALVEGDFYADPPDVELTDADEARFQQKVAYEQERLDAWLG
jgi:sulfide:quinone oxidoreductase